MTLPEVMVARKGSTATSLASRKRRRSRFVACMSPSTILETIRGRPATRRRTRSGKSPGPPSGQQQPGVVCREPLEGGDQFLDPLVGQDAADEAVDEAVS